MGVYNGGMMVDADGTRHSYSGTVTIGPNQNYTDFVGHTTDGTFIDYKYHSVIGGALTYAEAKLPNGTIIEYGVQGTQAMYPTRITDANGTTLQSPIATTPGQRFRPSRTLWAASQPSITTRTTC